MTKPNNPIKAIDRTANILEALKKLDGARLTELADHLDMTKSTIHHHLSTLEANELVVSDGDTYKIGMRFFEYGEYIRSEKPIYDIAVPEVNKLADETGELGNLLIEEHGRGIYLHRAHGKQAISLDTGTGSRVYLHHTALGKAILAYLPEQRVNEILERHGLPQTAEETITTRSKLFDELEEIRSRGYSTDKGERVDEVRAVAAPILKKDEVRGAVSVAGPRSRMQGDWFTTELPELVQRTADVISVNLTYS